LEVLRFRFYAIVLVFPLFAANYNVKTTAWSFSDHQSFAYAIQNATSLSDHIRFDLPGGLGGTITVDGNNTLNAGHLINLHTTIVTLAGASASLNTSSNMTLSGPFDIQCRLYVPNSSNLYLDGSGTNTLSSLEMWNSTLFIQGNTVINDYLSINRTAGSNCYFNVSATKTITVAGGVLSLMAPIIKLGDGLFHLANADPLVYNSEGIVVGSNITTGGVMLLGSTVDFPPSFSLATPSGATLSQISFSNTSTLASYGTITLSGDGGLLDLATNVVMNIQTLASTSATAYLAKTGGGTLRVTNLYDLPQPPKLYGGVLQFNTLNAMNGTAVNLYGGTLSLAEENTYPNELLFNGAASVFIPGSNVVTWSGTITSAATGGTSVFNKTGSGTLYLSGSSNNFGSPISVNEGVLRVATQGNISGTLGPPLITFNGGTLDFASLITIGNNFNVPAGKIATLSGANADLNGTFSGNGDLRLLSDNFTILPASASPFTGSVLKTSGFLNVNNNSFPNASVFYLYNGSFLRGYTDVSLSGNVSLSGGVTFWVNDNGSGTLYKMTLSGSVYSGGTLSKQGTGILYLTGVNSYSMGTNILAGILEGNADSIKGDITLAASSEVIFNQASTGTFAGNITGPGSLIKTGSAKLTLAGASNISNKVILSEGELEISSLADVGPINNFELNAGKLKVTTYSSFPSNLTVTNSPILEHSGLTLSGNIVGTGDLTINSGVYTNIAPPSNNTITGQITLTGGGQFLVVSSSFPNASGIIMSSSPILSNGGNINFTMPVTIGPGTTTLGVYGSSIFTFSAQVSGSTTIVKTGSGTIDFNTIQKSFSGDIVVSQGTVVIGGNSPLNSVSSVTNNGTFQVASTATSARLNNFESTGNFIIDSNIQLNNSLNKTISGSISGASALIKTGAGTTTISAANSSFSGGLFIDQGTVVVQGSFLTGNCATVATRTGSSVDLSNAPTPTLNSATGGGAFLLGSNGVTLTASSVSVFEITGPISGTGGSLTINGVGDYRFTGSNSYSGGTTVNGGILSGNTTGIQGNIINNSLVRFLDGGTYSGNMSGNGTLSVSLGGVLTLSGTNSFTGGINISGGTVAGNSGSIKGNITNSGALIFNQSSNGTYSGTILGNGPLTKNLSGNLNLTGASGTYTGNISVTGGSLGVNANYSSANISIAGGTTAYGAGSVKNMSNSGTLNPGNSIGTINITGDYTQSSSATLNIEIDPSGACDLVAVTGIANLNGTLNIIQTPGFYVGETTYTFLTAGAINSDFTTRNSGTVVNPVFVLTSTNYSLIVDSGGGGGGQFVPPLPNSAISGNSFEVASALFCDDVTSTGDLQQIKLGLVGLSPQDYLIALSSIAPDEMSGVTLIEMENQSKIINLLSNRTDRLSEAYYKTYSPMPKNTFFVSPISFWLNQRGNNYAIGYRGNTTGLGLGYENQWIKNTFYGFATAYTHSFYRFYSQQGRISSNGFYFSPYVSTKIENLYLTSGLLGSYDAMKFFRYIVYPGVNRTAYCQPSTWNLSGQVQCHYSLDLSSNKYLEPLFQMTFSGIYRNGTTENGADSLDFSYPSQWNATARALLKCTAGIVRCFDNDLSLDSRAALGYVLNGLITSNNYEANFLVPSQVCYSNLDFQGLNVNQSQLFSEIQFIAKLKDRGKASLDLSYQWGRTMNVASVNFSLEAQF
jgi:fibronectin-binding autotransporter adhesin